VSSLFLLSIPYPLLISKALKSLDQQISTIGNERMDSMSEIISSFKVIKMLGWEVPFINKVAMPFIKSNRFNISKSNR